MEWLVEALKLRAEGSDFDHARELLVPLIAPTNPGAEAIRKALTNVRQIVFSPTPRNLEHLEAGIALFSRCREHDVFIVWGLAIASYSFVAATAETIGRLLKVQEQFTAADLRRRLTERVGEREFVSRVARYNLSSFLDWGVVDFDAGSRTYLRGKRFRIKDVSVASWLAEAILLTTENGGMPFTQLFSSPMLFPFDFAPVAAATLADANPRLHLVRQSLNEEYLALA